MDTSRQEKPEKLVQSIPDAAWLMGNVSHNHVRNLLDEKVLDEVRIGRRRMVSTASIKRLLEAGGSGGSERAAA
jgi:hypothetical protein